MNQRRKNVASSRVASCPGPTLSVYRRTIHGANTIPMIAIALSATTARVRSFRATSHIWLRPRVCVHSTSTGTTTDESTPPSASS